jgi:hypothetical protein
MTLEAWEEKRGIPPEERTSGKVNQDAGTDFSDDVEDDESDAADTDSLDDSGNSDTPEQS